MKGQLRYLTAALAAGLTALAGYTGITNIEYWGVVTGLVAIAALDMIKHRNDTTE